MNQQTAGHGTTVRKVTWIGLVLNVILSVLKFTAGILGHSQVLIADAVHSLSDCLTDVAVIAGSHYWSKPPDQDHPYGHKRLETLVTIFIGVMLLSAGSGIGWRAIVTLHDRNVLLHPGWIALAAAAVSMISKEALYRWTVSKGKQIKSPALTANAWHHRMDAITSIPAFFAVGGAMLFPAWTFLDHVGAVFVSILIMQAAFQIIWPRMKEILDVGAPQEMHEKIKNVSFQNTQVKEIHNIRTRYMSTSLQVDMHVLVDGFISVHDGHDIASDVKRRVINQVSDIVDVVVHIEPY